MVQGTSGFLNGGQSINQFLHAHTCIFVTNYQTIRLDSGLGLCSGLGPQTDADVQEGGFFRKPGIKLVPTATSGMTYWPPPTRCTLL